jgi:NAD(P)-dependent dehydrogenase (short-subunit alcohol dehydrogenase family)
MTDIKGRTAVVTGGGSGIGRGLALALAAEGAKVVVADIGKDNADAVAKEIGKAGGSALAVVCDVGERASVNKLKDEANRAFGPVSLLFANAGVSTLQRFAELSDAEVEWVVQINLMGVLHCLKAFLPDMIAAKSGHVVVTSSKAGLIPASVPFLVPYSAAKAGLIGTILNLRVELGKTGVNATVFCPDRVTTQIQHSARYRPQRFGGPGTHTQSLNIPPEDLALFQIPEGSVVRSAEEAAEMVMTAVRKNRPIVLTDASARQQFKETYVDLVMSAFDDVDAFDKAKG